MEQVNLRTDFEWRSIRNLRNLVLLLVVCCVVKTQQSAAREKDPPDDSRLLNVIVLETQFARDDAQQGLVHVPPDFPVHLSRMVTDGRSFPLVPELPFMGEATLLDIFTFLAPRRVGPDSKTGSRSNEVARLKYKVKFLRWEADQYEAEIQCDSQMRKRENFRVSARRDTTTIVASAGPRQGMRLVVALTPVQSVPILGTALKVSGAPNIKDPVPIATPLPQYPENLGQASVAGLVKLKTVIRRDGTIDAQNFCLLECPHYLFARNALRTVTQEWKFKPGTQDGEPVDIIATVEVTFAIRR